MALADAMEQAGRPSRARCSVGVLLEQLDDADRATLQAWLAARSITSASIERALVSQNHLIRQHTIKRHRKSECSCAV